MSDTFNKYVEHGRRALEAHPDYSSFEADETESIAADTIASVLHAVDADRGLSPREAEAQQDGPPWELLERAWRSYTGDFEDLEVQA